MKHEYLDCNPSAEPLVPSSTSVYKIHAGVIAAARTLSVLFLVLAMEVTLAADLEPLVPLDIRAGMLLAEALQIVADKARFGLSAPSLGSYRVKSSLKGSFPLQEALTTLLDAGTGLCYTVQDRRILVFSAPRQTDVRCQTVSVGADQWRHGSSSEATGPGEQDTREVTVRAHPFLSFEERTLDLDYFETGGFQTVGDVLQSLPQNFAGGLNVGVISAGGSQNTASQSAAATANLRGLGSASTLVLVNGQRIATAEGSGAVDVSLIPLSAVERIEITTGSAAVLYGSDAVAGVVNIILKTRFSGVELSTTQGAATEGGDFLQHYSIVMGHAGEAGNLFAAADCAWQQEVDSRLRPYIPTAIAGTSLLPRRQHCSALFSATHDLPYDFVGSVLGAYTRRFANQRENLSLASPGLMASTRSDVYQYAVNVSLSRRFLQTWTGVVTANVSADNVHSPELLTQPVGPDQNEGDLLDNRFMSAQAFASGALMGLKKGPVQMELGAGYTQQDFHFADLPARLFPIAKSRRSRFAFVEADIPLLAPSDGAKDPLLSADIAVRSEEYSGFGWSTKPKLALEYTPFSSFKVSASGGMALRTPSLLQQFDTPQATLEYVDDPQSGTGKQSLALVRFGSNPTLKPETSIDAALDLTFIPESVPGARLRVGYYAILYSDRIEYPTPNTTNPLNDSNSLSFITRNPDKDTLNQIVSQSQFSNLTQGPDASYANATLIVDDRNQNIAYQNVSGVDLLSAYRLGTPVDYFESSLNAAYLDLRQKVTDASLSVPLSGTLFYPPSWRGRLGMSWKYGYLLGSVFVNYSGRSRENRSLDQEHVLSEKVVASWTTLDGQIGLLFDRGVLGSKTRVSLSVQNMFDRHPPLIDITELGKTGINYDSTNASPVGRFISLQITQSW